MQFPVQEVELVSKNSDELLDYYAKSSRELANKIFARAGVYLLVGLIISFTGLYFFYMQTIPISYQSDLSASSIFKLVQNFGILFFIEFVAFFFLRQYRSAMDEFRYYEAIKRKREEVYSLIKYSKEEGKNIDPIELMKSNFYSKSQILSNGETTEILESRKLEGKDLEIFEKVLDFAKDIKNK